MTEFFDLRFTTVCREAYLFRLFAYVAFSLFVNFEHFKKLVCLVYCLDIYTIRLKFLRNDVGSHTALFCAPHKTDGILFIELMLYFALNTSQINLVHISTYDR